MFTANIVDTSIFRSLGKPSNPRFKSLKNAVDKASTELWVPAPIYRELTDYGTDPPVNPYLDDGVEDGWILVALPLAWDRDDAIESITDPVAQAQHLTDTFLNQQSKYPVTNNWRDASVVALAVRLFEQNARIRIITHTADDGLARACARIPPEFGYYEIESRYYNPPQTAKHDFPTEASLIWSGQ